MFFRIFEPRVDLSLYSFSCKGDVGLRIQQGNDQAQQLYLNSKIGAYLLKFRAPVPFNSSFCLLFRSSTERGSTDGHHLRSLG
jgi:hypothetical protein